MLHFFIQVPRKLLGDWRWKLTNRRVEYDPTTGRHLFAGVSAGFSNPMTLLKDGEVVATAYNMMHYAGLDKVLDIAYKGGSNAGYTEQYVTPWINNATPVASDAIAGFEAKYAEETNYDEAARVAWDEGTPTNGVLSYSTDSVITASTGGMNIHGLSLISASGKSTATGILTASVNLGVSTAYAAAQTASMQYELQLNP